MAGRSLLAKHIRSIAPSALIFDLDGTLVESGSLHLESFSYALGRQGHSTSSDWYHRRTGLTLHGLMKAWCQETGEALDIKRAASDHVSHFLLQLDRLQVHEDVLGVLDEYSGRVPMALATNNLTVLTEHILRTCGLLERFEAVVCSDLPGIAPKPDPGIYLKCASALDQPAGRCCVLEDSHEGLRAGHLAGAVCVDVRKFR